MKFLKKIRRFWKALGPGLITGASDDDPSGIATYSQAGASFGLATLWTALFTYPLMLSIQEMCARIALVTSKGLAEVIKTHYPKPFLYLLIFFTFPAITLNIGADVAGMGAVAHLLIPQVPAGVFSVLFIAILIPSLLLFSYQRIAMILKWLCVTLFVYLIVPFLVEQDWGQVFRAIFVPHIEWTKEFAAIIVAILGTTISPYLFFWQSSMSLEDKKQNHASSFIDKRMIVSSLKEINDMRFDVNIGMIFSNLVMLFIILTTGSVLFTAGVHHIDTVEEAASALKPLAGEYAYLLFALGIISTGFLAIPVLAGSLSYILSEIFDWPQGMDKKFFEAKGFYITMFTSMIIALVINFTNVSPIQALIYTAIVYGVTAPLLIAIILHICNNKAIMKEHTNHPFSNVLGGVAFLFMAGAALALFLL